jgi:hypothetical protein
MIIFLLLLLKLTISASASETPLNFNSPYQLGLPTKQHLCPCGPIPYNFQHSECSSCLQLWLHSLLEYYWHRAIGLRLYGLRHNLLKFSASNASRHLHYRELHSPHGPYPIVSSCRPMEFQLDIFEWHVSSGK